MTVFAACRCLIDGSSRVLDLDEAGNYATVRVRRAERACLALAFVPAPLTDFKKSTSGAATPADRSFSERLNCFCFLFCFFPRYSFKTNGCTFYGISSDIPGGPVG